MIIHWTEAGSGPSAKPSKTAREPGVGTGHWKRPKYTLARGTDQDAFLLNYHPESQYIVSMSPETYLQRAAESQGGRPFTQTGFYNPTRADIVRNRMKEGQPLDALYFDYDVDLKKIVGQEGRHRALVAQELGIDRVPVIYYLKNKSGYVKATDHSRLFRELGEPWQD